MPQGIARRSLLKASQSTEACAAHRRYLGPPAGKAYAALSSALAICLSKGGTTMVVYLDTIFLLNSAADAAALYATARLSGLPAAGRRLAAAALLGGTYGALCALPGWGMLSSLPAQACAAAGLVRLAFGRREGFLRRVLLFFLLSCSLAGADRKSVV